MDIIQDLSNYLHKNKQTINIEMNKYLFLKWINNIQVTFGKNHAKMLVLIVHWM